jgi:hypothetical protein
MQMNTKNKRQQLRYGGHVFLYPVYSRVNYRGIGLQLIRLGAVSDKHPASFKRNNKAFDARKSPIFHSRHLQYWPLSLVLSVGFSLEELTQSRRGKK